MFKWWFLLVFLPSLKEILSVLWIFIGIILMVMLFANFVNFLEYQEELRKDVIYGLKRTDKIEKSFKIIRNFQMNVFKRFGILFVIVSLLLLIIPSKTSYLEMIFASKVFLTKNNAEYFISKVPNKNLKYLDKIIQEKLNEGGK